MYVEICNEWESVLSASYSSRRKYQLFNQVIKGLCVPQQALLPPPL